MARFDEQPSPYSLGTALQYLIIFVMLFGGMYLADMIGHAVRSIYAVLLAGAGIAFTVFLFRKKLGIGRDEELDDAAGIPNWWNRSQALIVWVAIPFFCWYLYARAIPAAWHRAAAFNDYTQVVGIGFTSGLILSFVFSGIMDLLAKKKADQQ